MRLFDVIGKGYTTMFDKSEVFQRYPQLESCRDEMEAVLVVLRDCFQNGGKLMIAGNGGASADAEHFCGELTKGFLTGRSLSSADREMFAGEDQDIPANLQGGLPAMSLGVAHSLISAWMNDKDPQYVFAQQVWGLGQKNDVLFGITTSGNSKNIVHALKTARAKGIRTIALTGIKSSPCEKVAEITIHAPAEITHIIQELHLPIYHALCIELEFIFFGNR